MIFKDLHPADIAEAISAMKKNERNLEFLRLSSELKVEVFSFLDINIQEEIVRSMTQEDYAEVLNNLEPDDRT
jgi:magnesium transporter